MTRRHSPLVAAFGEVKTLHESKADSRCVVCDSTVDRRLRRGWSLERALTGPPNDDDLREAFKRLERVFQAPDGTPEADEMEILVTLIEAYEQTHYPMGSADPVEAIKFRMEQQGLSPKDL